MSADSATGSYDPVIDDEDGMIRYTDYDMKYEDLIDSDTDHEDLDSPEDTILDENDESIDSDTRPLFPGSSITIGSFLLILALYTTKYNLTGEATQQLLNILSLILPNGHILCNTLHEFKKFFRNLKNPLINHYTCTYCSGLIENASVKNCPHEACGKVFDKKNGNFFLEMPLKNQILNLFRQESFYENLQHRFQRKVKPGTYSDIYDGKLYKSFFDNGGLLSKPTNLSFTLNTDGAAVFKSSKVSIWPVFLVINELPYKQRMKKENVILASLWFGNQKPQMSTFLKPLQKSMQEIHNGIECFAPSVGSFTCYGIVLCATADLPARSLLCNHIQYNGAFSCWKCEQEGKSASVGKGHARVFPFISTCPKGPERTIENVIQNSHKAVNQTKVEKGIKGPSWMLYFPTFNIVAGVAIDYMHGVLLGVEKLLLEIWFSQKFSGKPYSLYSNINVVNEKLINIRPTLDVKRLPRSILDLQYWKASEYRSFLLFYSAPLLHGILDYERFAHYLLLVNSMHILLKCGSTETDLIRAEQMLFQFCEGVAHFYDECFMRLNVHQLLHLADCVRYLGPLYTSSCFSFEDKNGVLLKMIKGTQNIDSQIVTGVSFVQKLPELKSKCMMKGSECQTIYDSIEVPTLLKRNVMIERGCYILGSISDRQLEDCECAALQALHGSDYMQEQFPSFSRVELNDNLIYGTSYTRMIKRDNSVVEYYNKAMKKGFGKVRYFISINDQMILDNIFAFIEPLECKHYDDQSNILAVTETKLVEAISIKNIVANCILVCFPREKGMYVCKFPNRLECD